MTRDLRFAPGGFVLAQWPNPPLWVALAGALVGRLTDDRLHAYATAVFFMGLTTWAYLELTDGVNWFRRLLGVAGLAYVLVRMTGAIE
ncbi:MAG: hypothetical protein ABI950_04405 [Solirubrobacteraceae bacterium]